METNQSILKKEENLLDKEMIKSLQTAQKSSIELLSHSFSSPSISEVIKETEKVDAIQILNETTKIEINKAFQKEFEQSLNKGFPLDLLINDTIITLNPDNTYEVTPNVKRELNTIKEIYLK